MAQTKRSNPLGDIEAKRSSEIFYTENLDQFGFSKLNRDLTDKRLRRMVSKMAKKNRTAEFPCLIDSRTKTIIDGQYRISAAKILKQGVHFILTDDMSIEDVADATEAVSQWTFKNYINHFVLLGKEDYKILDWFVSTSGFPIGISVALLEGRYAKSGGHETNLVRSGSFKVKNLSFAKSAMERIDEIREYYQHINHAFLSGYLSVAKHKRFNHKHFMQKVHVRSKKLVNVGDWRTAVKMILELYNFRTRKIDRIHPHEVLE